MPQDVDTIFDYRNNEVCFRYQKGQAKDYAEIVKMIERRRADVLSVEAPFMVAVALKETNEIIGEIVVKPKGDTIELGYTFSYRSQIAITSWTPRGKNLGHGWSRRIYP